MKRTLMNLFEALGHITINPRTFGQPQFRMRWQILYDVYDRLQVEVSEHLFSRLVSPFSVSLARRSG